MTRNELIQALQDLPAHEACDLLDTHGIFPAPGENAEDFLARAQRLLTSEDPEFRQELQELQACEADPAAMSAGFERTNELYGFSADTVRGYFIPRGIGPLWAGCAVVSEAGQMFILLREAFRQKEKWLIYSRTELIAHEQCHSARMVLNDDMFEEHFAYLASGSAFRRICGNAFRTAADPLLFLAGFPVFLIVEILVYSGLLPSLPLWPFFLLACIYPAFLFFRSLYSWRLYLRAKKNLRAAGLHRVKAVLFRSVSSEIREFAALKPEQIIPVIQKYAEKNLRWQIIRRRFCKD